MAWRELVDDFADSFEPITPLIGIAQQDSPGARKVSKRESTDGVTFPSQLLAGLLSMFSGLLARTPRGLLKACLDIQTTPKHINEIIASR